MRNPSWDPKTLPYVNPLPVKVATAELIFIIKKANERIWGEKWMGHRFWNLLVDLPLSWFTLSIFTVGRDKKSQNKITYCICIVREQSNGHLCAQEYPHRQRLSQLTTEQPSFILWSKDSQIIIKTRWEKKLMEPADLLLYSPKDAHTVVSIYTCGLRNAYPLTIWLLLPKLTVYLHSNIRTIDQKWLIPLFSWTLEKTSEQATEIHLLDESRERNHCLLSKKYLTLINLNEVI